ncbi:MAG: DUF362 domain-containing protein [Thermodesulfovibrionales bacterium]|nr:DUF362 domain-containing protein [Thermodesulfovibrionales bacterium]
MMLNVDNLNVSVTRDRPFYCSISPYNPSELYPEYLFGYKNKGEEDNPAYRAIRNSLILLEMDSKNIGQPSWNPLGQIINPGSTVVIKPNLVIDKHNGGGDIYSIITHPSVIRAVADYCWIALRGSGRLVIADAPLDECDFDNLLEVTKLKEIQSFYCTQAAYNLEIIDLRQYSAVPGKRMYAKHRRRLAGDPAGNIIVDLGKDSTLFGKASVFFGVDQDVMETRENHHNSTHRYYLSRTILSCDTLISVPKLKVHKLVGVTLNLKGMVGINTNKNYLVHYSLGTPRSGGDQSVDTGKSTDKMILGMRRLMNRMLLSNHYPVLENLHYSLFHSKAYHWIRSILSRLGIAASSATEATYGGKWFGNDTCWRMVADLARIIHYTDQKGVVTTQPQRRLFSVVDGIVGGDINGPLLTRSRPEGIIACGYSLVAVDIACLRLMGFDPYKFPLYKFLMQDGNFGFSRDYKAIAVHTDVPELINFITSPGACLAFEPHPNWKGYIEMEPVE